MDRGVTCSSCGASTLLPEDLRVPSFACGFCKATLQTAAYAGAGAVSADVLVAHMRQQIASPPADLREAIASAPKFRGESKDFKPSQCVSCKAPVQVPLDLTAKQFRCGACGHEQWITHHISDGERFQLDMQRQVAGNEALKAIERDGVPCTKCGGRNEVPKDGSVQIACRFCSATILLADHVDASAVARSRLKHNVFAMRDELMQQQKERDRKITIVVVGLVAMLIAGIGIATVVSSFLAR